MTKFQEAVDKYRKDIAPFFNANEFNEDVAGWFYTRGKLDALEIVRREANREKPFNMPDFANDLLKKAAGL